MVKNSSTILLPEWYRTLTTHHLSSRIMLRDVSTRWNSTHDMLTFAAQYRPAIDSMTDLGLRKYELDQAEWKLVGELRDVLKVSNFFVCSSHFSYLSEDIQRRDTVFLTRNTQSCNRNPSYGSHRQIPCHTASERQHSPAIRAALAIGKKTINKYYNKTDHSEVYRIAMGMSFIYIYILLPTKIEIVSSPSPPQVGILQKARLGCNLDRDRPPNRL